MNKTLLLFLTDLQIKISEKKINAIIQIIRIYVTDKSHLITQYNLFYNLFQLNNIGQTILSYDIRNCYQNNKFSFSDAINTAKAQATQCLVDKFNQAQSIVQNGRGNIENAFSNLANVGQILSECGQLTSLYPSAAGVAAKGACLNKVFSILFYVKNGSFMAINIYFQAILSIRADTILWPINIAKRIIEIKESIATIQTDMAKCGLNVIEAIYVQSTNAGQAIANCINEANGVTTTTSSSTTTAAGSGSTA